MLPIKRFCNQDPSFWAQVKFISESLGYSRRLSKEIINNPPIDPCDVSACRPMRRFNPDEIILCLKNNNLDVSQIYSYDNKSLTSYGQLLLDYLNERAKIIEVEVLPLLMNREEARRCFEEIRERLNPKCPLPMNKQKGEKKHYAYLTCIVNMLTEEKLGGPYFDGNPQRLPIIVRNGKLLRMLSRRMDGAYRGVANPHAVWEIKEYYGTTTFGSRVADGIYETILDGKELAELLLSCRIKVFHYLIIDDRFTWWLGRSYLCRIIDILHMGLVDEVLFGKEVMFRWPEIVETWPK